MEHANETGSGCGCWLDLAGVIGPNPGSEAALVEVDYDFGAPEIWSSMPSPDKVCFFASFNSEVKAREWIDRHGLTLEEIIHKDGKF